MRHILFTASRVICAAALASGFLGCVPVGESELDFEEEVDVLEEGLGTGTGLSADYHDNIDFTGTKVSRVDETVGFDWLSGSPAAGIGADTFSVRWTGKVEAKASETYTFYTLSDDGVRLWVNNQKIIDNWTNHGPTENSGTIALTANTQYDIKLEYFENGGGAVSKLLWSSPSQAKQIIPKSQLYPGGSGGGGGGGGGGSGPCTPPVAPVDVSTPNTVVGNGTPASCTEAAFSAAVAAGGIIKFNCGSSPHTLTVTSEKVITKNTVIDGGGLVTLSGGNTTRILAIRSTYDKSDIGLTVQNLTFINGRGTGQDIAGGGGAIFRLGGKLTVINSKFQNNHCEAVGQDVSGGAITSQGGGDTIIVGSTFTGNSGSNGGAIGNLGNSLTLVNSTITGNSATGYGGNPGNGGNGGGVVIDGQGTTITVCGCNISDNDGNAFGGGLFRVSYQGEPTNIDKSTFDGNAIPNQDPSMGGGLYLQGTTITMTNSTISNNAAKAAGGLYVGPSSVANLTNVTIAENTALQSLGGGVSFDSNTSGTVRNCTIASNHAPGAVAFGGGIIGGSGVTLANTIVANNTVGNAWNPISCTSKLINGGKNMQFPVLRAGGGSDDPGSLCSDAITIADPLLGPLQDNGGPTRTMAPAAGSTAIGKGTNCPATDQTGKPRTSACTVGAFEK